ncbi:MAG: hypothetical protein ABSE49_30450 [Polyangiaceae bacterium]
MQTRTLEYLRDKPLPATLEEWAALGVTIARSWQLDEKKKAKTDKKYCEGLCEDPDERIGLEEPEGRNLVDARRMLKELEAMFDAGEMPERGDEILDCIQAGMPCPKIAKELGMTVHMVRGRLERIRVLFEARLVEKRLAGGIVVATPEAAKAARAANDMVTEGPDACVPVPPPRFPRAQ